MCPLDPSDAATGYPALPAGATASAVAFGGDGKYLARGRGGHRRHPRLDGDRVAPRGLEWSADASRLFAVTTNAPGNQYWLHVIRPPAVQYDTRLSGELSHSPAGAVAGEPLAVRGRLESDGPAPTGTLKAERTDRLGSGGLSSVTVAADGTFTVDGLSRTRRDGDDPHQPSTAAATVHVTR
ncbi:hypothetical protein [Streptomyces broussonetiae]|uniref:Uncharacterized protein n=1 Tax=Streptomyces broussonetiae TaxID=2686304 RepID=A0ABV5E6I9_9ACTN